METSPSMCYELVNVSQLPSIDIMKSIKFIIFTARGLERFNQVTSKCSRMAALLYSMSLPFDLAMLLVQASIGRWFAFLKLICQLPFLLIGISSLRVNLLKCSLRTYDFWFSSVVNLINCVAFYLYLGDLRMIVAPVFWLDVQMSICGDANLQTRQLANTSLAAIVYQICLANTVAWQLTPGTHNMTILKFKTHAMACSDLLLNTLGTTVVFMIRTAYRKHQYLKQKKQVDSATFRCITYKCRVKLKIKNPQIATEALTERSVGSGRRAAVTSVTRQKLIFCEQRCQHPERWGCQ